MTTNAEWQARKEKAIARGESNAQQVYVERAKNAEFWDVEGNRFIDFGAGIAVVNTGHTHPKVVAAVKDQLDKFSHTCLMVNPYDSAVKLAEHLNRLAPGDTPKKSIFVTTGAEAVENCIKIARAHTGRSGVIAFNGGYHGRTNFTLGLTGKITPYKNLFGPFPGEIFRAPFPIEFHKISIEESIKALHNVFKMDLDPSDTAAIILEPVQGEGGFYPAPREFMQALRKICDEHGIVLICDEIQCGFGRTGKFFYSEYCEIEPDLMTAAKGIAGGFPLAAVVGKAEIMDAPLPGGLGGTYAGSPIGCAAALAVIEVIEEEKLLDRAVEIGERFMQRLQKLKQQYPDQVGEIRNKGAMIAMELIENGDPDQPNPVLTKAIVGAASKKGVVLLSCGVRSNVIRFLPALTAPDAIIDEGMDIVSDCMAELTASRTYP